MIDYYIRAADEAAMREALAASGAATISEQGDLLPADGVALDIIGIWYDQPAEEGAEPVARPGYYANVRSAQSLEWPAGVVEATPATPWRSWA